MSFAQQRVAQYPDAPKTLLSVAEELGLNPLSGCRAGVCHQVRMPQRKRRGTQYL